MRLRIPKILRRVIALIVLAVVFELLVVHQIPGARKSLHVLSHAHPWLVVLGVALEAMSLVAYSQLTHSVLPQHSLRLPRIFRINMASLSVSHVVPAGTAGGYAVGYRLLTEAGVRGSDAGFAIATQGIGSAVVLNVILWLALVISIPLYGFNPLYIVPAILGVLLIGFVAGLAILFTRGEERSGAILAALERRLPFVKPDSLVNLFKRVADRLVEFSSDRDRMVRAVSWAAANWLLDAASLWVFVAAFGYAVNLDGLLVAYGLANVLAAIPITPGGLGVVEGVLIPSLHAFHAPSAVATVGVIGWRLVNFWLPIPVGGASYLSLRVGQRAALS
jgi:uncharacterized protein (TIRG00374 family)